MVEKKSDSVVYQARLHWIIFLAPLVLAVLGLVFDHYMHPPYQLGWMIVFIAVAWEGIVWLTYYFTYVDIKPNRVVMCSGIIVRQTVDIPMSKIESIDIRQSILGSLLQYGSLVIAGTGGTRQFVNFIDHPLTCRRYIENLMYDTP